MYPTLLRTAVIQYKLVMSHVFSSYTPQHITHEPTLKPPPLFHHYEEPCLLTGLKWILNYLDYLRGTFCENNLENTVCSLALDEVYVREEKTTGVSFVVPTFLNNEE